MIRALIFDFDGLILDTETPEFQAWHEVTGACGAALPLAVWSTVIGTETLLDPTVWLEDTLGRPVNRSLVRRRYSARREELMTGAVLRPGVLALLSEARAAGLAIGLASSSRRAWVEGHLRRFALMAYFSCIRTREDVPRVKPDPALYASAVMGLGVPPETAVALEDSRHGLLAAKAAGLRCIVVPNPVTAHMPWDEADWVTPTLDLTLADIGAALGDTIGGTQPVR